MRLLPTLFLLLIAACALLAAQPAQADSYVILVAPKDSPAYAAAQARENGSTVFAERTLHRGLTRAAELLASGSHTVSVYVAQGVYTGKAGMGVWKVPAIDNPQGTLQIAGGFNDDFSGRQPFGLLTELQTVPGRDGAILQFASKSTLKELVVSGLVLDAAPSNDYDQRSNNLLKGSSRSYPLVSFSLLTLDRLVVADNVLMNGAHGAFDPYVQPLSGASIIDIQNNVFLNNVKAMKLAAPKAFAELNLRRNTFFLNWPFNPDPTSSNVSAVELYHAGGADRVTVEGNLFAHNPGGALQHDWPEERMAPLVLRDNLFYSNASLFEDGDAEAGVFAGKFGTNPRYLLLDLETVEDDFGYEVSGNVAMDPAIPIAMAELQAANSGSVQRENTVVNDVRRLFGLNQDGGTVAIANYAPAMSYHFPQPTAEAAQRYGAQPGQLWNPGR